MDNGPEFEQTPGDSEGQENLVCSSPWACKESDMTKPLNQRVLYDRLELLLII